MDPTAPALPSAIGLPPEQFAAAFPFHLAVDQNLRLVQAGSTLRRICPDVQPGAPLERLFRSLRPEGGMTFAWVLEHKLRFFLLEHRATKLQLRGEFVLLPGEKTLLFLGSPWFTDAAEIAARDLGFEDFAIHDPVVDMLQVYQASKLALEDARRLAAKLTAQRAELRVANQRLLQQEAETRKLALIAARTDNAVVLTDATGVTVWVNEGFTRLTGYTLEDMAGKTPGSVLQGPGSDPETGRRMRACIRQGRGFREEILNYAKDGRAYWLSIEVQPIHDDAGRITNFMAIETDITSRRAAQRRLAIQLEVSRVLAEASDSASGLPRVLQVLCEQLGCEVGQVWRVVGESLQSAEIWHMPGVPIEEFIKASRAIRLPREVGLPGKVWASGKAEWIPDVTCASEFIRGAEAAKAGWRAGFAFPVRVRGELWGVAEFFTANLEERDEALLETFTAVGHQIGQFIARRQAEEALRETNRLQQAILEGANYSIISASPDGVILTFNSAAERMLGYTSEEMVGRATPASIHVAEEIAARAADLTRDLGRRIEPGFEAFIAKAAAGMPDESEWTYVRKDGSRFPVLLSITALRDESGGITGYLGVASDITERRRVASELLKAKESAESANRAKSDFLASISHEIRTPMNGVLGMINLLLETPLNPKQREFALTVARSGEALIEIINEILDFSKIEAGEHFQLEEETFSLQDLVTGVVQLLRPRADAGNILLNAEVAPGIPDRLKCDDGRLRQVLINLVGNGIKFTDRGSVSLRVDSVRRDARQVQLRFEVTDTGIGISPEDFKRLFQPFTQFSSSKARRRGGTGLGLAISKRIVDLMGGRIGFESTPGQGSKFWFELGIEIAPASPVVPDPAAVAKPDTLEMFAPSAGPAGPNHPIRILVAEDHDTNRRLAQFMLETLGHRADFAADGIEAVEAWARSDHDVILMDCQMPEMDGFEATREIRRREKARASASHRRVHIIALTANALKGDRERCLSAGMDGYISKPFTLKQLSDALKLDPAPAGRPAESSATPMGAPQPRGAFDPQRPADLCAELGDDGVGGIIEDFLNELPHSLAELRALAGARRWSEIARAAHSLQGVGASFGLVGLSAHLRALEASAESEDAAQVIRLIEPLTSLVDLARSDLRHWLDAHLNRDGQNNPPARDNSHAQ